MLDRRVAEYPERLDAADAAEGESMVDGGAVREALEVLRRQQAQTAQGLSHLAALGATQRVSSEPEAKQMKGHGPAYNVQTVVDTEHALIVTHEVTTEANGQHLAAADGGRHRDEPGDAGVEPETGDGGAWER